PRDTTILGAMSKKPTDAVQERPGRLKQIRMVAQLLRKADPKALPIVFASAAGALVVVVLIGVVFGRLWFFVPMGILTALAVGMIVFGQLAQRAQYRMLAGQPGAAVAILKNMRGGWTVTEAVSGNRNLDMVHRAVGRPGVVLVSEGPRSRVGPLLGAEKKRISRAAAQVPIYDVQVGEEEGQIPVDKLQRHLMKLPRNLKKGQVAELNDRLQALPRSMQMPKGPIPKGVKMPKGPKPRLRCPPSRSARERKSALPGALFSFAASFCLARSPGLHVDDDRVGGAVVEAAVVAVPDQRGHDQHQQQRPGQRPAQPHGPPVQADHAEAAQPLADRRAEQRGEDPRLDREDDQRPHAALRRVPAERPRQEARHQHRQP